MKVSELIEQLQTMPPDANVIGMTDNYEMRESIDDLIGVRLDKYMKVKKSFRDMMDRTDYVSEVYERDSNGVECVMLVIR